MKTVDRPDALRALAAMGVLAVALSVQTIFTRCTAAVPAMGTGLFQGSRSLMPALAYVLLALCLYYRPCVMVGRWSSTAVVAASALCVVLAGVGMSTGLVVVLIASMMLFSLAYAWTNFLFVYLLTRVRSLKLATCSIVGGIVLWQLLLPIRTWLGSGIAGLVVVGVTLTVLVIGLTTANRRALETLGSTDSPEQLQLTDPLLPLRPSNAIFFGVFLFSLAWGFSGAFGVPEFGAQRVAVVVLLSLLLFLLLIQHDGQEDRLFTFAVLFMMTGLLMAPVALTDAPFLSNTLLFLGSTCFDVLIWMVMYGLGRRNVAILGPVFGVVFCFDQLGTSLGRELGRQALELAGTNLLGTQAVMLALAMGFFAFVWLGFRTFSFSAAIEEVEPFASIVVPLPVEAGDVEGDAVWSPGHEERARALAEHAGLTPREGEVFELLAHGRNAGYIMDTLHVTRNTAKAHIGHVYSKLGVHSHQELISLVESEAETGAPLR